VEALMRAAAASYGGGGAGAGAASASGVQKLLLMARGAEEIDRVRPRWAAAFGARAEVTQAVVGLYTLHSVPIACKRLASHTSP
jgi:hypothetical protein